MNLIDAINKAFKNLDHASGGTVVFVDFDAKDKKDVEYIVHEAGYSYEGDKAGELDVIYLDNANKKIMSYNRDNFINFHSKGPHGVVKYSDCDPLFNYNINNIIKNLEILEGKL